MLLVEDDEDHVFLVRRALAEVPGVEVTVEVVGDGEQATERLTRSRFKAGGRPQLVLLDLKMPRMDGLEVLRRIRSQARTAGLPVVVLTTSNEERDIVESYRLGANSFVRKPVVFEEFVEAANVLGVYWLLVNQPAPPWRGGD